MDESKRAVYISAAERKEEGGYCTISTSCSGHRSQGVLNFASHTSPGLQNFPPTESHTSILRLSWEVWRLLNVFFGLVLPFSIHITTRIKNQKAE